MTGWLTWLHDGSALVRKGKADLPLGGIATLLDTDFDALTIADPISLTDFRAAMGDSNVGGTSTVAQTALLAATSHGQVIEQHFPGGSTNFDTTGIKAFIDEPFGSGVDEVTIEYWFRILGDLGGGGKLPGPGGIVPGNGNPPTGGSPSPYGWTARLMWLSDQYGGDVAGGHEIIGYVYDPTQPSNNYGQNRHTGVEMLADTWFKGRQRIVMNTIASEGSSGNADGIHQIWINDSLVYSVTNQVWRIYAASPVTHLLWHEFYGGATNAWYPAADAEIEVDDLLITTPAA